MRRALAGAIAVVAALAAALAAAGAPAAATGELRSIARAQQEASTAEGAAPSSGGEPPVSTSASDALAERNRTTATVQDGFDTCGLPTSAGMDAWARSSPYTAVGAYIGGVNLACAQPPPTAAWVQRQLATGWSILPLYVGRQAPCTTQAWARISAGSATSQGVAAARDASRIARALGMGDDAPIYLDVEGYTPKPGCDEPVITYVDAWAAELHRLGHRAGLYGSALSPVAVVGLHQATLPAADRLDDLWVARWDGRRTLDDELVDSRAWVGHRAHQYRGGHDETWGGVTAHIDSNLIDADVVRRSPDPAQAEAFAPFASWDALVGQLDADLAGATMPLATRARAADQLAAGSVTPAALVELLLRGAWFEPHVAPVARLYGAYFGRTPDRGGLAYWAQRHRDGTSLAAISQHFATSSEFVRRTGGLTDQQFVERIYTDVLGRAPDGAGLRYWTARLAGRRATRGQVMASFSESSEHVRATKGATDVLLVIFGLLARTPTEAELRSGSAVGLAELIDATRLGPEYATRVR